MAVSATISFQMMIVTNEVNTNNKYKILLLVLRYFKNKNDNSNNDNIDDNIHQQSGPIHGHMEEIELHTA